MLNRRHLRIKVLQLLYAYFQSEEDNFPKAEKELLLPEEPDNGNIEYKLKLESPTLSRVEHLTTQMVFRLNEGNGLAYY